MKLILLMCLIYGCLLNIGCVGKNELILRPITIKVIDSVSKEPISNLEIYYLVSILKTKTTVFGVFPRPEPTVYNKLLIQEKYITNQIGELALPERCLQLKKGENLYFERIFINININRNKIPPTRIKEKSDLEILNDFIDVYQLYNYIFYRPNPKYNSFYILSSASSFDPNNFSGIKGETLDVRWNSGGLLKNTENFIVNLKSIEFDSE